MLLADAAQVAEGKLYVLGGGWSITSAKLRTSAIALKIEVPWTEANQRHRLELALVDGDGQPVLGENGAPITVAGDFETGRPAGLAAGSALDVPLAITLGPLPLRAGSRYVWRCTIDGRTQEDWEIAFATRP